VSNQVHSLVDAQTRAEPLELLAQRTFTNQQQFGGALACDNGERTHQIMETLTLDQAYHAANHYGGWVDSKLAPDGQPMLLPAVACGLSDSDTIQDDGEPVGWSAEA
jgi:hypothetical protein